MYGSEEVNPFEVGYDYRMLYDVVDPHATDLILTTRNCKTLFEGIKGMEDNIENIFESALFVGSVRFSGTRSYLIEQVLNSRKFR